MELLTVQINLKRIGIFTIICWIFQLCKTDAELHSFSMSPNGTIGFRKGFDTTPPGRSHSRSVKMVEAIRRRFGVHGTPLFILKKPLKE